MMNKPADKSIAASSVSFDDVKNRTERYEPKIRVYQSDPDGLSIVTYGHTGLGRGNKRRNLYSCARLSFEQAEELLAALQNALAYATGPKDKVQP